MSPDLTETCDVAVIGGGPSGLALARRLKQAGLERVVVLERDQDAGGVPRHCGHYPFGLHEFKRLMKGPDYARRKVDDALLEGVDLRTGTTVTALHGNGALELSSDAGVTGLTARRVALCTGAREASRAQRFISGSRPQGIITTGALQAFVYLESLKPFRRPVILGTELVSFSSLLTCRHAGIRPVAMIEPQSRITARSFSRGLPALMRVPLFLGARILRIIGDLRVEAVEIETSSGDIRLIETDGVICTGQFRPEAALIRNSHLNMDAGTGGPEIDQYARATDPAYFCAGNLLRPVETHAWCAREGGRAAEIILEHLNKTDPSDSSDCTPIKAAHPAIRYVLPQRLSPENSKTDIEYLQMRLSRAARGRLVVRAGGREVWSKKINALPERRLLAPLAALLPYCGSRAIDISLEETGA